jgi:hypothetical protein
LGIDLPRDFTLEANSLTAQVIHHRKAQPRAHGQRLRGVEEAALLGEVAGWAGDQPVRVLRLDGRREPNAHSGETAGAVSDATLLRGSRQ